MRRLLLVLGLCLAGCGGSTAATINRACSRHGGVERLQTYYREGEHRLALCRDGVEADLP